jgi:hypothetical protein
MYHGHGKLETLKPIISSVGYLYENSMMPNFATFSTSDTILRH